MYKKIVKEIKETLKSYPKTRQLRDSKYPWCSWKITWEQTG